MNIYVFIFIHLKTAKETHAERVERENMASLLKVSLSQFVSVFINSGGQCLPDKSWLSIPLNPLEDLNVH